MLAPTLFGGYRENYFIFGEEENCVREFIIKKPNTKIEKSIRKKDSQCGGVSYKKSEVRGRFEPSFTLPITSKKASLVSWTYSAIIRLDILKFRIEVSKLPDSTFR